MCQGQGLDGKGWRSRKERAGDQGLEIKGKGRMTTFWLLGEDLVRETEILETQEQGPRHNTRAKGVTIRLKERRPLIMRLDLSGQKCIKIEVSRRPPVRRCQEWQEQDRSS